jgi:hypothetical protein
MNEVDGSRTSWEPGDAHLGAAPVTGIVAFYDVNWNPKWKPAH